jgi:hypothetical protein
VKLPPTERKLLIACELYRRQQGRGPSWSELASALGIPKTELGATAWLLKRNRLLSFTQTPRSIRVTRGGLAAALGKGAGQP